MSMYNTVPGPARGCVVDAGLVGEEGLVGASLDDGAVVENGDFVAEFAGGQAVADVDGGRGSPAQFRQISRRSRLPLQDPRKRLVRPE